MTSRGEIRPVSIFPKKNQIYPPKIFFCIYLLVMPKYWGKNYFAHGSFPEMGQKQKTEITGTAGGPGGRDRTLAVKSRKTAEKSVFFSSKNQIYPPKIFFFAYIF